MVKKITKNVGATERVISLALGAWVTYRALRDLRYRSVPALASGAYLLVRGDWATVPSVGGSERRTLTTPPLI